MTVQELVDALVDLINGDDGEAIRTAVVTAEHGYLAFDVLPTITKPLRYTPEGVAVLTLDLRESDE